MRFGGWLRAGSIPSVSQMQIHQTHPVIPSGEGILLELCCACAVQDWRRWVFWKILPKTSWDEQLVEHQPGDLVRNLLSLWSTMISHHLTMCVQPHLRISTPRRFGKTISVCLFVAALIFACPNVEISIYSTCKRFPRFPVLLQVLVRYTDTD